MTLPHILSALPKGASHSGALRTTRLRLENPKRGPKVSHEVRKILRFIRDLCCDLNYVYLLRCWVYQGGKAAWFWEVRCFEATPAPSYLRPQIVHCYFPRRCKYPKIEALGLKYLLAQNGGWGLPLHLGSWALKI